MKLFGVYSIMVAAFLSLLLFTSSGDKTAQPMMTGLEPKIPQIVKAIPIPQELNFAGEKINLENFDVFERFERELLVNTYLHSTTLLNLKAAGRHFPLIEKILTEQGIPDDFKYLAVAESNLRNATSPVGAKGVWQIMKSIGQYYGLEINSEVDERYHLEKSTLVACKYLKESKRRHGSWTEAAAAYNAGDTRIRNELENQRGESYFDLNLVEETSRYVFRILAMKEIMSNPYAYGFQIKPEEQYRPLDNFKLIEVKTALPNLADFARQHGTSYRILKVYNPWLLTSKLTNTEKKTYYIKVPA